VKLYGYNQGAPQPNLHVKAQESASPNCGDVMKMQTVMMGVMKRAALQDLVQRQNSAAALENAFHRDGHVMETMTVMTRMEMELHQMKMENIVPQKRVLQTSSHAGLVTNASPVSGNVMSRLIVQMALMRSTVGTQHAAVRTSLATTENASPRGGRVMGTMTAEMAAMSWDVLPRHVHQMSSCVPTAPDASHQIGNVMVTLTVMMVVMRWIAQPQP